MSKKTHITLLSLFLICTSFSALAQKYRYIMVGNDTIPVIDLPVCVVGAYSKPPANLTKKQLRRYKYLERRVRKVYPYAQLAATKLKEYEGELALLTKKKDRRKVMKKVEKALKEQYGAELKNLSISQGKILLKLIDRQTGRTSYELIKEMRGSFAVGMWQGLARLFGHNLKAKYDASGDDKMIEQIINRIEAGV